MTTPKRNAPADNEGASVVPDTASITTPSDSQARSAQPAITADTKPQDVLTPEETRKLVHSMREFSKGIPGQPVPGPEQIAQRRVQEIEGIIRRRQAQEAAEQERQQPVNVHRGQARIAYRLAAEHQDKLLYVAGIGWLYWDGTRWFADKTEYAKRAVLATLRTALADSLGDTELRKDVRGCESDSGIRGVLAIAQALETFACPIEDLDADPYLLNLTNGTLDLHTLELRPHSPADRITKITSTGYNPSSPARSRDWETFLETSLPNPEDRAFLQRYVGLALVGRVIEHVLVIATGSGRNGKGILAYTTQKAMGSYGVTASNDLLISSRYGRKSAGELAAQMVLRGARWAVMSELNKGDRMDESTMKNLTGGDTITAKHMGQGWVEFKPSHSFLLLTNDLPTVDADSAAAWERIRVVPFDVSFAGREDKGLEQRLELQLDAVLAWAIEGLRSYQQMGLAEPEGILAKTRSYHAENDPLARFVEERCHMGPAWSVAGSKLRGAYAEWARVNGEADLSPKAIAGQIKRLDGVKETRSTERGWQGIGLRPDPESSSDQQ